MEVIFRAALTVGGVFDKREKRLRDIFSDCIVIRLISPQLATLMSLKQLISCFNSGLLLKLITLKRNGSTYSKSGKEEETISVT